MIDADQELRKWLIETAEAQGAAIMHVGQDDEGAPFAFTVGAFRRFGIPEAVVIGLPPEAAETVLDTYLRRSRAGERFVPGRRYAGFLENGPVTFEKVNKGHYQEFFGHAFLLYRNGDFPATQVVVSSPDGGSWPWSENAPGGFAAWQPILTASGDPESWTPGVDGP